MRQRQSCSYQRHTNLKHAPSSLTCKTMVISDSACALRLLLNLCKMVLVGWNIMNQYVGPATKHIEIWFPRFKTLEPGKVKMYVCQWLSRSSNRFRKGDFLSQSFEWVSEASTILALCSAVYYIVRVSLCIKNIQQHLKHVLLTDILRWCHCLRPLPYRRLSWLTSIARWSASVELNSANFKPRPRPCDGLLRHCITLFEA